MSKRLTLIFTLVLFFALTTWGQKFSTESKDTYIAKPLTIKAKEILDESLASEEALLRMNSIEVISNTKEMGLMPRITKLLTDPIVPVRFAATLAIGDTRYMPATYMLTKLKKDPDMNVRVGAAYALTVLGEENLESIIMEGIQSDDQTIKANSALVMGKLRDPKFIKVLHWVLKDELSSDKAKIQAIESLAMLGDEGMYQKAWALLISKRADDRVIGIRVMGHLRTTQAVKAIKTMINDEVVEVQMAAASMLAKLGEEIGEQKVIEFFEITSPNLEKFTRLRSEIHAGIALGYCSKETLEKYVPTLMCSSSPEIRLCGAQSALIYSVIYRSVNTGYGR